MPIKKALYAHNTPQDSIALKHVGETPFGQRLIPCINSEIFGLSIKEALYAHNTPQDSIALKRAGETLDALVAGEPVRQEKLEWSLQVRAESACMCVCVCVCVHLRACVCEK